MYKKLLLAALVSGAFGLTGCASDGDAAGAGSAAVAGAGAADVFGKSIFLRGELTDPQWAALPGLHISTNLQTLLGLLVPTSVILQNQLQVFMNGVEIQSF